MIRNSTRGARLTSPVTAGRRATKRQMLWYTLVLFPLAIVPMVLGVAGYVYGATAALLGALYIALAVRVLYEDDASESERRSRQMFGFSILYLFILFTVLIVDRAPGLLTGLVI